MHIYMFFKMLSLFFTLKHMISLPEAIDISPPLSLLPDFLLYFKLKILSALTTTFRC